MEQLFQNSLANAIGAIIAVIIIGIAGFIWKDKRPWVKWIAIIAIFTIIALFSGYQLGFRKHALSTLVSNDTSDIVPVETLPMSVFSYEGEDDQNVGFGDAHLRVLLDENLRPNYQMKYYLPPDSDEGYAGFVFHFDNLQDLSDYEFIEFTVEFNEDALADFTIRDASESVDYVRLGDFDQYRDGIRVITNQDIQTVTIPLSILRGINLKAVEEIGFNVGRHFTQGQNEFIVSNVNLKKRQ